MFLADRLGFSKGLVSDGKLESVFQFVILWALSYQSRNSFMENWQTSLFLSQRCHGNVILSWAKHWDFLKIESNPEIYSSWKNLEKYLKFFFCGRVDQSPLPLHHNALPDQINYPLVINPFLFFCMKNSADRWLTI